MLYKHQPEPIKEALQTDRKIEIEDCENKKESEKLNGYLDLLRNLKKLKSRMMMVISVAVSALGRVLKRMEKKTERSENKRNNWDHSD